MRLVFGLALLVGAILLVFLTLDLSAVYAWAIEAQRGFQNTMAGAVRALKAGDPGAYLALLAATGAYGFVHALGPGHGKYLVGGIGLGTAVSPGRLLGLAFASSLTQAIWAIVLVYGGFFLLEASARQFSTLAEDVLAPASYLAIGCVGLALAWRGSKALRKSHHADHQHGDCHCHAHGPAPDKVAEVGSIRDAVALVLSVAIRPCTGAVFLLVIAWQMDLKTAGAAAVIVMGFGTAALTSLVAVSSLVARRVALASSLPMGAATFALPALQIFAGVGIALFSLGLLRMTV